MAVTPRPTQSAGASTAALHPLPMPLAKLSVAPDWIGQPMRAGMETGRRSRFVTGNYQVYIITFLVYFPPLHLLTIPAGITIIFTEAIILSLYS